MPRPEQIRTDVTDLLAHARAGLRIDNDGETRLPDFPPLLGVHRTYDRELMSLLLSTSAEDNVGALVQYRLSGDSHVHDCSGAQIDQVLAGKLEAIRKQFGPLSILLLNQFQGPGGRVDDNNESKVPAAVLAKRPGGILEPGRLAVFADPVQLESAMTIGRPNVVGHKFQATSGSFFQGPMCSNGTLAPVDYAFGLDQKSGEEFDLKPGMPTMAALRRRPELKGKMESIIFALTDEIYNQNADIVRAAVRTLLNG